MGFYEWLRETIDWNGEPMARWKCIQIFVEDGLIPLLTTSGYTLSSSERHAMNYIATGLYNNRKRSHLNSVWPIMAAEAAEEDVSHFQHVLNWQTWENFWSVWGCWEDVDPTLSSRATDRRMDIERYVWELIDLENSPQTQILNEIIAGGDEEEDAHMRITRQKVDTYILESVEYNGWGGYRK